VADSNDADADAIFPNLLSVICRRVPAAKTGPRDWTWRPV